MNVVIFALAVPLSLAATPALAQDAPGRTAIVTPVAAPPTAGATVYDPAGGVVGTIASITGDMAVIDTGTNKIGYPMASIGTGANGPTIALTKVALDASYAEQKAKAAAELTAKLAPGTAVRSRNGSATVGTIKAVDAEFVTLTAANGDVRLPKSSFSLDQLGVIIGFTAEEFAAAIAGTPAAK